MPCENQCLSKCSPSVYLRQNLILPTAFETTDGNILTASDLQLTNISQSPYTITKTQQTLI